MAPATNRMPDKRPTLAHFFVMTLQAGKVFLFGEYRGHDERAVRKREAFVRSCMVASGGLCRGSFRFGEMRWDTNDCIVDRCKGDDIPLGFCFTRNNDAG